MPARQPYPEFVLTNRRLASPWNREHVRSGKREAVLRMAAQGFNERGFVASTLDEVAERLNITKPTLYYYVDSKDEILYECVRMGLTMLQEAIQAAGTSGGSALDKRGVAVRKDAELLAIDFGICVIRVSEKHAHT